MEAYLENLNLSQRKAVLTTDGPVLVIAGAGSGKTRVIEYRVAHLVKQGIDPRLILLLTFTRRAAREMLSRAARHESGAEHVEGGTFHSFAYKMLRNYGSMIGLPTQFSILDEGDAEEALHRCATLLGFYDREDPFGTAQGKRFPKKETLRGVLSAAFNRDQPIDTILVREYSHFLHLTDELEKLKKKYAEYKLEKRYLDYDDLLFFLKKLLQQKEIQPMVREQYQYIMVDEYQDTNKAQGDITYLLARDHKNVMVVGDDAQSIYGFRGASHENIMEFPKRFPGCKIIKLEENYRSTQKILDVANATLENMVSKYAKCMVSAHGREGQRPELFFFPNPGLEAKWIAGKIKELRDSDLPFERQAVLFRSSNVSIPLQAELAKRDIPFQVFGGLKFYETAHAKDLIAHLKIFVNLSDELAWNRVLTLIEGVGPKTASIFIDRISHCQSMHEISERVFLRHENQAAPMTIGASLAPSGRERYGEGIKRLRLLLQELAHEKLRPSVQFQKVLAYYTPIFQEKYDDWPRRMADLLVLQELSRRYKELPQFLADFAIEPPALGEEVTSERRDEKPLTLSTIHSAKGLEWDTVYLIGLTEGVLPSSFALNRDDELEEEHRLLYVGLTRAKNYLFLSVCFGGARNGFGNSNEISRFLSEPNVLACVEQRLSYDEEDSDSYIEAD